MLCFIVAILWGADDPSCQLYKFVSGRFPSLSNTYRLSLQQQGHNASSFEQIAILGGSGEIRVSPFVDSQVHRDRVLVDMRDCVSETRMICKNQDLNSVGQCSQTSVLMHHRILGVMASTIQVMRLGCLYIETNSVATATLLESQVKGHQSFVTSKQCPVKSFSMVVTGGECSGWSVVGTSTWSVDINRCSVDCLTQTS